MQGKPKGRIRERQREEKAREAKLLVFFSTLSLPFLFPHSSLYLP
jgi:hypothetical protein